MLQASATGQLAVLPSLIDTTSPHVLFSNGVIGDTNIQTSQGAQPKLTNTASPSFLEAIMPRTLESHHRPIMQKIDRFVVKTKSQNTPKP